MAVKTIWPITHSCGHHAERDLSGRAADRRAGFAEWLAKQECTDCWRAAKEGDEQDKAARLEAKRAEEQAESEAWAEQYRMPPLEGTDRAVAWGVRCRHQILAAADTNLVLEGFSVKFSMLSRTGAGTICLRPQPRESPRLTSSCMVGFGRQVRRDDSGASGGVLLAAQTPRGRPGRFTPGPTDRGLSRCFV
ncbi:MULTISPECIES: hypothetical protein [unclassified Streptomyces]|uniref:hypothetical protein n=1 Tax=Streptomyces TaxID=1883 RepID=UPI000B672E97|nr:MULTISPECIES: hypothetical protein [unclassified Streptomyces]SNB90465.1 hypothetical protein SAMN02745831_06769 [Streptomyces sp. PgraA7]